MYTLRAKVNFYDKEHPGRLVRSGELLATNDDVRVKKLLDMNFAEVVAVDRPETPEVESANDASETPEESRNDAPAKESAEAEVVAVGSESYPVAAVKEALKSVGVKTAINAGLKAVSKKVSELPEEQVRELISVLTK